MPIRADDVASLLLDDLGEMTAWKLQKLCYYSQAWHLAWYGTQLFGEPIEAWTHGPVVYELYRGHRGQYKVHEWRWGRSERVQGRAREVVVWVEKQYGRLTAEQLSRMTHMEVPWLAARQGLPAHSTSTNAIDPGLMAEYYGRQQADPEHAVELAVASAELEGVALDPRWDDLLMNVADGSVDPDSAITQIVSAVVRRDR
jgi:uncharacterized phage-associated protein